MISNFERRFSVRFKTLTNSNLQQLLQEEEAKNIGGFPTSKEFHMYSNLRENLCVVLSERYSIYSLEERN
jgi:hypothetical protein